MILSENINTTNGKLISITGPSFSGKTYLVSKLLVDYPNLYVINFEKHFVKNSCKEGYLNFYKDIAQSLKRGENVICESVYNFQNNPYIRVSFKNNINILCFPSFDDHKKRFSFYISNFGWPAAKKRLGLTSIEEVRRNYNLKYKFDIIYDGYNYNKVRDLVCQYVKD